MSLSSTTSRVSYTGNGSVDTYSYTFKVFDEDDLLVTVRDTSDVQTTLVKTTDYTVTGVGATAGGTIVLVNSAQAWLDVDGDLKTGYVLVIRRKLQIKQETDIRNADSYYPEVIEDQFDSLVMIDQQQQDEIDRSVKLPESVSSASFDPTLPSDILDSADRVPIMNPTGDGFAAVADWPTATAIAGANADALAAAASAAAALVSETNAATSETNAATSEANALTAETNAETAETNAAASAAAASASASSASTSASTATTQAGNAATSAANAATSETNAETAETNAAASAAAALVSENNAAASEAAAAVSEANAAIYAENAIGFASYVDDAAYVTANGAAADGNAYYNSTTDRVRVYANGAWSNLGSGGGGSSLDWIEDALAPIASVEYGQRVYAFADGETQYLYAAVRVPSSYQAGSQINLRGLVYGNATSTTLLMQTLATLIRTGTDAVSSTTNQRTSTNSAITLATTANRPNAFVCDLTDSSGQINGVSVSAGDLILVRLTRDTATDTATVDAMFPAYSSEVTFT